MAIKKRDLANDFFWINNERWALLYENHDFTKTIYTAKVSNFLKQLELQLDQKYKEKALELMNNYQFYWKMFFSKKDFQISLQTLLFPPKQFYKF